MGIVNHKQKRIAYNHNERDEFGYIQKDEPKGSEGLYYKKSCYYVIFFGYI